MAIPGCLPTSVCWAPCACVCCCICGELGEEVCAFKIFVVVTVEVDRAATDSLICLSTLFTIGQSAGRFIKVTLFPTLLASRVGMGV